LEPEKVADGAVTRRKLALNLRIDDPLMRGDGVAEIAVEISEPGKVTNAPGVDSVVDLPPSVPRLAEPHRKIFQFFQVEPEKISAMFFQSHFAPVLSDVNTCRTKGSRFPGVRQEVRFIGPLLNLIDKNGWSEIIRPDVFF
jgi:hypothetical protein